MQAPSERSVNSAGSSGQARPGANLRLSASTMFRAASSPQLHDHEWKNGNSANAAKSRLPCLTKAGRELETKICSLSATARNALETSPNDAGPWFNELLRVVSVAEDLNIPVREEVATAKALANQVVQTKLVNHAAGTPKAAQKHSAPFRAGCWCADSWRRKIAAEDLLVAATYDDNISILEVRLAEANAIGLSGPAVKAAAKRLQALIKLQEDRLEAERRFETEQNLLIACRDADIAALRQWLEVSKDINFDSEIVRNSAVRLETEVAIAEAVAAGITKALQIELEKACGKGLGSIPAAIDATTKLQEFEAAEAWLESAIASQDMFDLRNVLDEATALGLSGDTMKRATVALEAALNAMSADGSLSPLLARGIAAEYRRRCEI